MAEGTFCSVLGMLLILFGALSLIIRTFVWIEAEDTFKKIAKVCYILFAITLCFFLVEKNTVQKEYELFKSQRIIAIKSDKYLEGKFVIGSGNINDVNYFVVYRKLGDGYKLTKYPVNDTLIVETNEIKPSVETIVQTEVSALHKKRFLKNTAYYRINVPVGTIIQEFKL